MVSSPLPGTTGLGDNPVLAHGPSPVLLVHPRGALEVSFLVCCLLRWDPTRPH